ncbi:hypothetical protein MBEHAL_0921 [Halarchaeum acidiphilum MH1-52-1]|uniref:DUF424 domain-containing protein n=1 Tax=Halarchaeum acidiphilum MH1-52-1 TaxID=1261545 RepID=U2YEE5_9EURY|nr:DUF424 family protein [Halarchaeum acidiphilum]GAD52161.1 hypothetical protein MBEHAL_0921 [Halarchaeum acidiphilum MH1-52-1]
MSVRLTERRTDRGLLVAAADTGIVGETYDNGTVSVTVEASFYGDADAETTADELTESLGRASVANLVGDVAVTTAVDAGYVDEATVVDLGGVPHAQYLRM